MKYKHLVWTTLLLVSPLAAQEPKGQEQEAVKPDPELDERIDELRELTQSRKPDDAAAIKRIDAFLQSYPDMHRKDQASIRLALAEVLGSSRVRRKPAQQAIYVAAATALGEMGARGGRLLVRLYQSPKFDDREWVGLRATLLKSIGKTRDERLVEFLVERAQRDPQDKIMQAAGAALGSYEDAELAVRKEIAEELIKKFNEVYNQAYANVDPTDPLVQRAKETLVAITHDWNQTLRKVTKQRFSSPLEWQRFYNNYKAKDWDSLGPVDV